MGKSKSPNVPLELQDRDISVLRGLFESRVMTGAHASALFFEARAEAAKKRLQKLKAAGFIAERRRRPYHPAILFLTSRGHALLKEKGVLAQYPPIDPTSLERRVRVSELRIQHELAVMDVKAAFQSAIRGKTAVSLEEFGTWPLLYEFKAIRSGYGGKEFVLRPDGFVHIKEKQNCADDLDHRCFLELDRSTEAPDILAAKALCYLNYYRTGDFAVWNGASRSETSKYPFRVLMVFRTAERRNNIAERILRGTPQILTQVWMTTIAEAQSDP